MKIVIYNFVQPGDPSSKQGGGVAVYQGNLLAGLQESHHSVIMMSCGDRYDAHQREARLECTSGDLQRAVIFNSPMVAPAHFSFYHIDRYAQDPGLDHIPTQLRQQYGDIDVFHFQNIEGLTKGFFQALRAAYPKARLILSAHNYNSVCPQVNLWHRERENCVDYRDGNACVNCLLGPDQQPTVLKLRRVEGLMLRLGVPANRIAKTLDWGARKTYALRRRINLLRRRSQDPGVAKKPIDVTNDVLAARYRRFREVNIELASTVFDSIIAVSERTRQVLIERGMPAGKIGVSYIGTAHHEKFRRSTKMASANGHVHLGYLGYMRADKGFFFFLEALAKLDEDLSRNISITVAAPIWDGHVVERFRDIGYKFRAIRIFDGYSHSTLDEILAGVNLGVVPVLWEDNLPQVAIEMVARGIPILTSDRGGSQEIGRNPDFIFKAGSHKHFASKVSSIVSGKTPLASFWEKETRIFPMSDHIRDLRRFYEPSSNNAGYQSLDTCHDPVNGTGTLQQGEIRGDALV